MPAAPSDVAAGVDPTGRPLLSWAAPVDAPPQGDAQSYYYDVYRSASASGSFTKVNTAPITATSFVDATVPAGTWVYMVRAVRLEVTTASGSYYNPSQGAFMVARVGGSGADALHAKYDPASDSVAFFNNAVASGDAVFSVACEALDSITFAGAGGDDTLVLDLAAKPVSVFADAGGGANDLIRVIGSSSNDVLTVTSSQASLAATTMTLAGIESIDFDGGPGNDQMVLSSGSFRQAGDLKSGTDYPTVIVNSGASLVFDSSQHLAALNLAGGTASVQPGGDKVLVTSALTLSGAGRLDLADNDMVVRGGNMGAWNGSVYTGITGLIAAGRSGAIWSGNGIITSAAATSGLQMTLGVSTAAFILGGNGVFSGESVAAADVLIKYTYAGDANLNGVLEVDDYGLIDFSYLSPGQYFGFEFGDFDYNGVIDIDDYGLLDFNYPIQHN
jgi:hypothetical protein